MPTAQRSLAQTEKIFAHIVDLMEELTIIYSESEEEDDEAGQEREVLTALVEEAAERGMEELQVERILRSILSLAHSARQG